MRLSLRCRLSFRRKNRPRRKERRPEEEELCEFHLVAAPLNSSCIGKDDEREEEEEAIVEDDLRIESIDYDLVVEAASTRPEPWPR